MVQNVSDSTAEGAAQQKELHSSTAGAAAATAAVAAGVQCSSRSSGGGGGTKQFIVSFLETKNADRRKYMCNSFDILVDLRFGLSRQKHADPDIYCDGIIKKKSTFFFELVFACSLY